MSAYTVNIILNEKKDYYFGGESVEGHVELLCSKETLVQDIFLNLETNTQVKWQDLDKKLKHGEIIFFIQNFEGQEMAVIQKQKLLDKCWVPKGQHIYKFSLNIPQDTTSSLASRTGSVRHELVVILRDLCAFHELGRHSIAIRQYCNIMQYPRHLLPTCVQNSTTFCWWHCKSNPLYTNVTLSSTALLPGDTLKYVIRLDNRTQYCSIRRVSTFVIQSLRFRSLKPKVRIETELKTLNYECHSNPCKCSSTNSIENIFQLPCDLESNSLGDPLIAVDYRFQVLVVMRGFLQDISLIIPLKIGSHWKELADKKQEIVGDGIQVTPPAMEDLHSDVIESIV